MAIRGGKMVMSKYQKLKQMIDWFFEDNSVKEISVKFSEPLRIKEVEFKEIIGDGYDGSNKVVNNGIHLDEFTYDEKFVDENENEKIVLAKLSIEYIEEEENIKIKEIQMWRETKL